MSIKPPKAINSCQRIFRMFDYCPIRLPGQVEMLAHQDYGKDRKQEENDAHTDGDIE